MHRNTKVGFPKTDTFMASNTFMATFFRNFIFLCMHWNCNDAIAITENTWKMKWKAKKKWLLTKQEPNFFVCEKTNVSGVFFIITLCLHTNWSNVNFMLLELLMFFHFFLFHWCWFPVCFPFIACEAVCSARCVIVKRVRFLSIIGRNSMLFETHQNSMAAEYKWSSQSIYVHRIYLRCTCEKKCHFLHPKIDWHREEKEPIHQFFVGIRRCDSWNQTWWFLFRFRFQVARNECQWEKAPSYRKSKHSPIDKQRHRQRRHFIRYDNAKWVNRFILRFFFIRCSFRLSNVLSTASQMCFMIRWFTSSVRMPTIFYPPEFAVHFPLKSRLGDNKENNHAIRLNCKQLHSRQSSYAPCALCS